MSNEQPQTPQPHASYNPLCTDFWCKMSARKSSLMTVASRFLLVAVCVASTLLAACAGESSARTGVSMQPSVSSTVMPTQPPQPLSGATLGGTRDGFTYRWGAPTNRDGNLWYTITFADGTMVNVGGIFEHTGSDGIPHVTQFHIEAPSGTRWSDEQGIAIALTFSPPDAKHVRDWTTSLGTPVHVYMSTDLAMTFSASDFKTAVGDPLAPGTFRIACGEPGPNDCSISMGE